MSWQTKAKLHGRMRGALERWLVLEADAGFLGSLQARDKVWCWLCHGEQQGPGQQPAGSLALSPLLPAGFTALQFPASCRNCTPLPWKAASEQVMIMHLRGSRLSAD